MMTPSPNGSEAFNALPPSTAELAADLEAAFRAGMDDHEILERFAPPLQKLGRLDVLENVLGPSGPKLVRRWTRTHEVGDRGMTPGLVRLSEVEPESVRWLWPARIPLGKLTILDGDPGLLKSTLTLDLAARLSRGDVMPDGTEPDLDRPAGTVLLTAEDGLADTVRPRLDAAGADTERIVALSAVASGEGESRLPDIRDSAEIAHAVNAVDARLLLIDPLMAYLPEGVNPHRDADVRRALAPLSEMANAFEVALLAIRHLNKSDGKNPKYRGGGSIGFIGAARSGLLVAEHPDDPIERVLATTKANLSPAAPSLSYRAAQAENDAVQIEWLGESAYTASDLLSADGKPTAKDHAKRWLEERLVNGPVAARALEAEVADLDFSWRTLENAKKELGVVSEKTDFDNGHWQWRFPGVREDRNNGSRTPLQPSESKGEDMPTMRGSSPAGEPKGGESDDLAAFGDRGDQCAAGGA